MADTAERDEQLVTALQPRWVAASLRVNEGVDPLGLQTTTQDRLTPLLLPGVLELSRRARYFSFHTFLLDEYRRRRMPPNLPALSRFIKRREWDLGLAVHRCPRHCGSSPVGARRLANLGSSLGPYPRRESVESDLGGYGLYYRSPLESFGIVAKSGTMLGDEPIPIDLVRVESERAIRLAAAFRAAVENTRYYRRFMWLDEDLPTDVVDEYSEAACLCRLRDYPDERQAVFDAVLGADAPSLSSGASGIPGAAQPEDPALTQRRRSFAHYLSLVAADPEVVANESAYRNALWSPPAPRSPEHAVVSGEWSGLIAKDVWQEGTLLHLGQLLHAGSETDPEFRARALVGGDPSACEGNVDGTTEDRTKTVDRRPHGRAVSRNTPAPRARRHATAGERFVYRGTETGCGAI